jgi:hypothetical protein
MKHMTLRTKSFRTASGALGAQSAQADADRLAKAVVQENTKALTAQGSMKESK